FMRSGTTLLEQVLSSNPKVVALEEKTLLATLSVEYATSVEGLDALAALDGEDLARARAEYWTRARTYAPDLNGRIFVDKQPLNTLRLCLIAKLFPKAKILFALRDPRDVVFSCYRRHFRVNMAMFEFLDLEDAARFYASVMNLGQIYRDLLPLNLLEHRYEDMVRDFEGRVRAVCEFIGLEWSDSMREFHKNAPSPDIRSPSAGQVQRPLYGEGVGQWRLYSQQLAPMLPILAPWVEKFGYSPE
ncbi:MAG TPA: sulfotransferase, partial [Rhizomicrobium sp.]|nr:sulfotransferase [Rhizomicrobium sp.]